MALLNRPSQPREEEMKNLKNFMARHPFGFGFSVGWILLVLGIFLAKQNPFWFLLCAFAGVVYIKAFLFSWDWEWVCTSCGKGELLSRHEFCSECGSIMHAVKKEKIFCPRSHRVSKYDKFCPKCGVSLNG